jgi:hypothetical protein
VIQNYGSRIVRFPGFRRNAFAATNFRFQYFEIVVPRLSYKPCDFWTGDFYACGIQTDAGTRNRINAASKSRPIRPETHGAESPLRKTKPKLVQFDTFRFARLPLCLISEFGYTALSLDLGWRWERCNRRTAFFRLLLSSGRGTPAAVLGHQASSSSTVRIETGSASKLMRYLRAIGRK